jgi:adenosine/AMP kinase
MVCTVKRATEPVAQVIIVEANAGRAVALVLSLAPSAEILSGDQVEARANSRI